MSVVTKSVSQIAAALRSARRARRISIASLAAEAGVSPRLVSEFEQNKRPNVSLETALRLISLVELRVVIEPGASAADGAARAREARAVERRRSWVGAKTTLHDQQAPEPPASPEARIAAVANVSRLAAAIKRASSGA